MDASLMVLTLRQTTTDFGFYCALLQLGAFFELTSSFSRYFFPGGRVLSPICKLCTHVTVSFFGAGILVSFCKPFNGIA